MYPFVSRSYKNRYPFRLSTTSFIYPDNYSVNVKMLGSIFDEIELIFFESTFFQKSESKMEIQNLISLKEELKIDYNVHLPTDTRINYTDKPSRHSGLKAFKRVLKQTSPLLPTSYTMHLPCDENSFKKTNELKKWQNANHQGLIEILETGINSRSISIETLTYPFEWIEDIIVDLNLSICLDIGHLILYGFDYKGLFEKYNDRISVIHIHGVSGGKDHLSFDRLNQDYKSSIIQILKHFTETVSIEVFSYDHLSSSLQTFDKCWSEFKFA